MLSNEYRFGDETPEEAEFYRDSQDCNCLVGVMAVGLLFCAFGFLIGYYVGAMQ